MAPAEFTAEELLNHPMFLSVERLKDIIHNISGTIQDIDSKHTSEKTNRELKMLQTFMGTVLQDIIGSANWKTSKCLDKIVIDYATENHRATDGTKISYNEWSFISLLRMIRNCIEHAVKQSKPQNYIKVGKLLGYTRISVAKYFLEHLPNLLPVLTTFLIMYNDLLSAEYNLFPNSTRSCWTNKSAFSGYKSFEKVIKCAYDDISMNYIGRFVWAGKLADSNQKIIVLSAERKFEEDTILKIHKNGDVEFKFVDKTLVSWKMPILKKKPTRSLLLVRANLRNEIRDYVDKDTVDTDIYWITEESHETVQTYFNSHNYKTYTMSWNDLSTNIQDHIFQSSKVHISGKSILLSSLLSKHEIQDYFSGEQLKKIFNSNATFWQSSDSSDSPFFLDDIEQKLSSPHIMSHRNRILVGAPFIGKTETLKIYCKSSEHYRVHIELLKRSSDKIPQYTKFDDFPNFLKEFTEASDMNIQILIRLLQQKTHNVELVFDGIEKLLEESNDHTVNIRNFAVMCNETGQICEKVTFTYVTRPQCLNVLQKSVNTCQSITPDRPKSDKLIKVVKVWCKDNDFDSGSIIEIYNDIKLNFKFLPVFIFEKFSGLQIPLSDYSKCKLVADGYLQRKLQPYFRMGTVFKKLERQKFNSVHAYVAYYICSSELKEMFPSLENSLETFGEKILDKVGSYFVLEEEEKFPFINSVDYGLLDLTSVEDWILKCQFADPIMCKYFLAAGFCLEINGIKDICDSVLQNFSDNTSFKNVYKMYTEHKNETK